MKMTQTKKQLFLQALNGLGLLRLFIASQQHKVRILMLHGVIDPSAASTWKPLRPHLTTEQLTQNLLILSQYYQFVSLQAATEMLAGTRPLIPNSLVLTFDDGYRNNLKFALPILRQFKAPATIFLSTRNVTEQKPLWFDRLDYAVQSLRNDPGSLQALPELAKIDFSNRETLARSFMSFLHKEAWAYPTDTAMRMAMALLIERMEQRTGHGLTDIFADDPWSGILNWNEVHQAADEIHFESHCVDHPRLTLISPSEARHELISSQEIIAFHTGRPCTHIAYPYGSYNKEIISLVRKCNYYSAVTTTSGLNRHGDNMLTLRRIPLPRTTYQADIVSSVSGLANHWHNFSKLINIYLRQNYEKPA